MITKIEIEGIPPFKEKTGLGTDQKVNLIYGLNGTGKTTLSNFLYNANKIGIPDGVTIEYSEGEGEGKDTTDAYEILVYNQRFVKDNFYESSEIRGIFSLSKDNTDAQKARILLMLALTNTKDTKKIRSFFKQPITLSSTK